MGSALGLRELSESLQYVALPAKQLPLTLIEIFNGAHIKDHAIQVHTQNEQHPVVLRYPPPSSHQPPHQPPIMIQHTQPLPQLSSPQSSFSYSTTPYAPSSPVMDAYYTHVSYPASNTIPHPGNVGHHASFSAHVPLLNHSQYTYSSQEPTAYYPPAPENFAVRTEFRKIVIKGLPDSMTTNDVYKLIEWALKGRPGYESTWIEEVTLPTPKSGKSRRHACVLLHCFPVAEHVKTCVDGMAYEGKKLSVEFAKEGATLSSGINPIGSKERVSSRKSEKKSEKKSHSSCSKETDWSSKDSTLETHHRPRTPAVVDGSGGRSKHKH
jgi:hypothetical protein